MVLNDGWATLKTNDVINEKKKNKNGTNRKYK